MRRAARLLLPVWLLLAGIAQVHAQMRTVSGLAAVIDGDTMEIKGERIRLFGIDAPELQQTCRYLGQTVACGRMAADALAWAVAARPVTCQGQYRDRHGRLVAICHVGAELAVDLNGWLVENGAAIAERRYSDRYAAAEERARQLEAGIWASDFEAPSDWRRQNR